MGTQNTPRSLQASSSACGRLRCARPDSVPWAPVRGSGPGLVRVALIFVGQPRAGACSPGGRSREEGAQQDTRCLLRPRLGPGTHASWVSQAARAGLRDRGSRGPLGANPVCGSCCRTAGLAHDADDGRFSAVGLWLVTSRMASAHCAGFSVGAEASVNARAPGVPSPSSFQR